jgi:hypothetical protein
MLYFINENILKIYKAKFKLLVFIKMWFSLLKDLSLLGNKKYYIFSNQNWHYGWDYEIRKNYYKKIFSQDISCVFLDLNDKCMVNFFLIYKRLINSRASFNSQNIFVKKNNLEVFCRNFWDLDQNLGKVFPCNSSVIYHELYIAWKKNNLIKLEKKLDTVYKIFEDPKFEGLVVSQFGYEDWAWASVCHNLGKVVFSPEANFGFTKLISPIETGEAFFVKRESEKLKFSDFKLGINSLNSRCVGKFNNSVLGYYMKDIEISEFNILTNFECKFVFYLHAFGDSSNNQISNYSNSFGIDYFHATLKILEEFEKRKEFLCIKLHPLSKNFNYDIFCNRILDNIVNTSKYISYCKDFKIQDFSKYFPNASIITGRGSIISEACFLKLKTFSFCKSIFTELGMSILFDNIDVIINQNQSLFNNHKNARNWAIKYESVRLNNLGSSIFELSNYNKNSKLIISEDKIHNFLNSESVVVL